jgi:formimidoylglutamate deiminase
VTDERRTATVPAMVNAHSHAFQRDLRGRGERPAPQAHAADDFWSWREAMYRLAGALDPESMRLVAARAYREMAAAGYGAVGEFHYVHHRPDGRPYDDPNALAIAVAEAGVAAGLAVVLLPAAYHRAGWDGRHLPPTPGQRRFCDPTVNDFLARVDGLRQWAVERPDVRVGVAAHSVRAVPAEWLTAIADYADRHGLVRHVHAAEQRRELSECEREHGCSPVELLERTGFLGERTSVVHGIHVSSRDIGLLAERRSIVVSCPTTEGNLGDGHLPALSYRDAGLRLAVGSDSQVRIDPFEEARELETGARRQGQTRHGLLAAAGDLWGELVRNGHASLGLAESQAGRVKVDLDHSDLSAVPDQDVMRALATCASAAVVEGLERPARSYSKRNLRRLKS